jgi:uncharacterized repeat protein (TIGR03803 family)
MKTKLLYGFTCMLIAGTISAQTQQMLAITKMGGTSGQGSIIHLSPDGSGFSVDYSYECSITSGCHPKGNLMQASDGYFYGACFDGGEYYSCTIDRFDPATGTYTDVYDFDITNGDFPYSGLVEAPNGKLYGVASSGGTSYMGVLYSFDLTTLLYIPEYSFSTVSGSTPHACPILRNNVLYGVTTAGGGGVGVLYGYDILSHTYSLLFNFNAASGTIPEGSLFEAGNGILYGMTSSGGANNKGVIFSFDCSTNTYSLLHSFDGPNGANPYGSFMQAVDGKLYGVTTSGGANNAGVLFSYDLSSNGFVKLYDFTASFGSSPMGNLFQSPDGKLYGTANSGGASGMGVLYSYNIALHIYTVVQEFNGANGAFPEGGFIMADFPTSVNNTAPQLFSVYPNPVSDEIN